jgi:prophage regulatory protein
MNISVLRLPDVVKHTAQKPSTVYLRIKRGLFPPPVKLSERASVWPESECSSWVSAKIRGASDDEIRELVKTLVAQRTCTR